MIRFHKGVRIEKKTNHSKSPRSEATGLWGETQWPINHPGQVMESAVHDLTKMGKQIPIANEVRNLA
jgi:hypothetical protein